MRRVKWLYALAVMLLCLAPMQARRLRLMTYNIHHAEGMDGWYAPERIAQVISEDEPDVVALQEVDSASRRVGGHYVAGDIARHLGMHATFAGAIPLQGGKYGIALLSRTAPRTVQRIPLPGREEERALLIADFGHYVVCCTHLSLTEADRLQSVPLMRKALRRYRRKPVFIMGDFNDTPQSALLRQMGRHFQVLTSQATPTYPYDQPSDVIDYIITRRGTSEPRAVRSHMVVGNGASDHCPVMVEVEY